MALARDQYLFLAKLAEQTERYEEMVTFIRQLVELVFSSSSSSTQLTVEERNLLFAANKNIIGKLRAAWRSVLSQKEKGRQINDDHMEHYRCNLEKELLELCTGGLGILDKYLLPSAPSASEARVFYLRMKGDYHRYLAEFKAIGSTDRKEATEDTLAAYKAAEDVAFAAHLSPAHPMRLGLALNICVFYYDILNESEKACDMAKQAIDDAISELDTLGQKSYKESTRIMQLLLDNFTLWTSNMQQEDT